MKKELGHIFLKRLGKKILRPGGIEATNFLIKNIDFKNNINILEVACNRGINLINLAKKYPQVNFYGIDIDPKSIEEANNLKKINKLNNLTFNTGNALNLDFEDNKFDFIINEAMLTMFPNHLKEKILKEYYRILKIDGLLLTQDIMLIDNFETVKNELSDSINININPINKNEWISLFEKFNFKTINSFNGKLSLMTLNGMLKDEGIINTIKIILNGLKKENREQFIKMKKTFTRLKNDMNFVCFVNKK